MFINTQFFQFTYRITQSFTLHNLNIVENHISVRAAGTVLCYNILNNATTTCNNNNNNNTKAIKYLSYICFYLSIPILYKLKHTNSVLYKLVYFYKKQKKTNYFTFCIVLKLNLMTDTEYNINIKYLTSHFIYPYNLRIPPRSRVKRVRMRQGNVYSKI